MTNNLANILKQAKNNAYRKGHADATHTIMELSQMAFCIAMNDVLGIGENRFEKVRQKAMEILGDDFINDAELTRYRMEERYKEITGHDINESILKGAIKNDKG